MAVIYNVHDLSSCENKAFKKKIRLERNFTLMQHSNQLSYQAQLGAGHYVDCVRIILFFV